MIMICKVSGMEGSTLNYPVADFLAVKLTELPRKSVVKGKLPRGCQLCARGSKMVLLVTGKCGSCCYYCPLSEAKLGKDVVYADEMKVGQWKDVISEAESIGAEGAGITGGDPLAVAERTAKYIRGLKKRFGDGFHIHLYTASTDIAKVRKLAAAGLDELRFHPPPGSWGSLERTAYPKAIGEAAKKGMVVGVEIPAIPGERIAELLDALESAEVKFVNLNELEFSETNWRELKGLGFEVADDVSSGVKGSEKMARKLVRDWKGPYSLHYCSAGFKDGVQLRSRLLRRAKRTALPSDVITKDGTLLKGVIETKAPTKLRTSLLRDYGIPAKLLRIDAEKRRLEVAPWILEDIAGDVAEPCFIVEEYPTADRLEVERRRLN